MKKTWFLLLILATVSAANVFGQMRVIPKIGVNISNVAFDDDDPFEDETEGKVGLRAGIGLSIPISELLSFQPELLYSQKGFNADVNILNFNLGDGYYRFNYLEVPLLLRADLDANAFNVHLNAGPTFGYFLGGKLKGEVLGVDLDDKLEFKDDPNPLVMSEIDANRLEVGLAVGGGIGIPFGDNKFLIDVRYNMGLTDYDDTKLSRNRVLAITAGVQIPL